MTRSLAFYVFLHLLLMLLLETSAADAGIILMDNPNGSKTFLINDLAEFFKNGKAILVLLITS